MGALRTILAGLALALSAAPLRAEDDLLRFFATCVGRFSAEMEHRWLLARPSHAAEAERAAALDILDSLRTPETGPQILSWRIDAKMAQSALLTRATFNDDATDARWASLRAQTVLSECRATILPGAAADSGV